MLLSRSRLAALCLSTVIFPLSAMSAPATKPAVSDADNPAYMWDLSDLYKSPEAWTAEHDKIQEEAKKLEDFKGTLGKSSADMLKALSEYSHVRKESARLSVYASLKADENVKIGVNQERQQAAQALETLISAKTAWLAPEILTIGADKVHAFEKESPELEKRFGFYLEDTLRAAPHTLGVEAEGVIAEAGNVLNQPNTIYSQLANGELPFPTVTLSDGTKIRLDQAAYTKYRQSLNRADRKAVFDNFWHTFKDFQGTMGASLTAQVLGEVFEARVRHFPNSLAAATFGDNMPETVYRTLVAEANKGLPVLHRYLEMRKKALGITDELQYYDAYPPIFDLKTPPKFTVDDSKRITLEVTSAYGPEYTGLLKKGFSGRWMNLFPHEGKANGAYMNGAAYDVHPYLLFNNHDDYESLSTFVHEWGHGVHTLLTTANQPFEKSNYSTFIAETASIGNEMLLNDYMVRHAKSKAEKLYYLGQGLELIRTTFFRQTMFAEFQLALHEEVEKGGTLSGERMTDIYCGLLKKYYGDAQGVMKINPDYCIEWAFIPHFYYGFYVYQYATSMAGAALFTNAIEHEGKPARDRFIDMLKAGGSDYPYALYKKAGLDMATPAPYEALLARMTHIMDQIDELQKK
ncbi:MAG TPA: oligoendopeptidase F [Rhizomicrobium sp.]|nr:oligoendopeptidase F [Rhizomicrobium sp.]